MVFGGVLCALLHRLASNFTSSDGIGFMASEACCWHQCKVSYTSAKWVDVRSQPTQPLLALLGATDGL